AIVALDAEIGVATKGERDFFKPRRTHTKASVLVQAASLLGVELSEEEAAAKLAEAEGFWGGNSMIRSYVEEPVFDG
ncbi:MAG: hypothetical protein ACPGEB_03350, partial [Schleiferiaceae bacterium]